MVKKILLHVSKIGNVVLAWFNFCLFFALRPCWSGISKTLGYEKNPSWFLYNLPVIIWILLFLIALGTTFCYVFFFKKEKNIWSYIFNGVNIVFLIAIIVVIALGAIDYMDYVWINFLEYLLIAFLILLAVFFIFIYPKTNFHESNIFKYGMLGIICLVTLGYIVDFSFNWISTGAVVYVVEDDYQIVFSSQTHSRAWVEINGERYFDNYNGSNRSYTRIHKVTVPQEVLDNSGQYEIHVQKITYEGPFGGYFGRDISQKYNFRPLDASDGINYYSLADIHMAGDISYKAAEYMEDKELLLLAGDIVSMMDTFNDANLVNVYAHQMTKGEIPVVYARGNHEIKGKYSEQFHNFVGAKGESFYYNFYLDNIYGLVLDVGEDHDDDYWEYYDTAYYDIYRNEQIDFLKAEIEKETYKNYDYKLVVSHIPLVFINSRKNHLDFKNEVTELLNQMDIDMVISGHQHDLFVFEPDTVEYNADGKMVYNQEFTSKKTYGGLVTDHNFLNLLVSKRGYTQTDSSSLTNSSSQIGLGIRVDFANQVQKCVYNNSKYERVNIVNAFADINYGNELVFSLITNKHI